MYRMYRKYANLGHRFQAGYELFGDKWNIENVQECTKMYSCFQAGYGVFGCKQNVQNVQKCTDLYVCFPVGYELFENNIFSAHILASAYCVSEETIKYLRHFSRCWVLVECQWRHQKSGALLVTGTQVYQIETESAPCPGVSMVLHVSVEIFKIL